MLRILVLKSFSKGVRSYEKRITSNWWYNIVEAFMGSPLVALLDIFKIAFFMILCIFYSSYYRYIVKKKKKTLLAKIFFSAPSLLQTSHLLSSQKSYMNIFRWISFQSLYSYHSVTTIDSPEKLYILRSHFPNV